MASGSAGSRCLNNVTKTVTTLTLLSFVLSSFSGKLSLVVTEGTANSSKLSNLSQKGYPFPDSFIKKFKGRSHCIPQGCMFIFVSATVARHIE